MVKQRDKYAEKVLSFAIARKAVMNKASAGGARTRHVRRVGIDQVNDVLHCLREGDDIAILDRGGEGGLEELSAAESVIAHYQAATCQGFKRG